jgi:hypothetical protein
LKLSFLKSSFNLELISCFVSKFCGEPSGSDPDGSPQISVIKHQYKNASPHFTTIKSWIFSCAIFHSFLLKAKDFFLNALKPKN